MQTNAEETTLLPPLLHSSISEVYQRKVEGLQRLLEAAETRDAAMESIRALIDRVILTPRVP